MSGSPGAPRWGLGRVLRTGLGAALLAGGVVVCWRGGALFFAELGRDSGGQDTALQGLLLLALGGFLGVLAVVVLTGGRRGAPGGPPPAAGVRPCPRCGTDNEPYAARCRGCGDDLGPVVA